MILNLKNPWLYVTENTLLPVFLAMLWSSLPGKAFFEFLAPTHIPIYLGLFPFLFHCTVLGLSVYTAYVLVCTQTPGWSNQSSSLHERIWSQMRRQYAPRPMQCTSQFASPTTRSFLALYWRAPQNSASQAPAILSLQLQNFPLARHTNSMPQFICKQRSQGWMQGLK